MTDAEERRQREENEVAHEHKVEYRRTTDDAADEPLVRYSYRRTGDEDLHRKFVLRNPEERR